MKTLRRRIDRAAVAWMAGQTRPPHEARDRAAVFHAGGRLTGRFRCAGCGQVYPRGTKSCPQCHPEQKGG